MQFISPSLSCGSDFGLANRSDAGGHVQRRVRLRLSGLAASQTENLHARHFNSRSDKGIVQRFVFVSAITLFALLSAGCGRKSPQTAAPAPEVLVTTVQPRDVPRVLERVATLDGFINANINAQVSGYITSRDYKEGSVVKKGDLLFRIDSRPFDAALAQAKANLAKARATQAKADADEKRAIDLFNNKVTSPQERDTALQAAAAARADTQADEAAVEQAQLNWAYTRVIAPIDGIAGIATAQVGDLVGPNSGPLTTISQLDPIKAIVTTGEGPFTDFISRHPNPDERQQYINSLEFELILGNGNVYPKKGKFYALDRSLDIRTGSIRYEVTFPNAENALRPGQFGKVRFVADMKKGAMVIPQEAVNELQGSYQVAVVGDDNKVSIRPVKMGERIGALWEVTDGLKPGDKVVVEGIQKAREGTTVTVKEWTAPAPQIVSDGSAAQKNP